ncbi:hypothetical protein MDA_GLEAN10009075 [Myotis davidii]|uniref:Uncharacterized protein n=1 Tax=Myotis davidii TaxID=225400 RepID=L5LCR3_MYODS|nr:hypothetical protein MDA_GLEAN10009075 [Myotis davidii]
MKLVVVLMLSALPLSCYAGECCRGQAWGEVGVRAPVADVLLPKPQARAPPFSGVFIPHDTIMFGSVGCGSQGAGRCYVREGDKRADALLLRDNPRP